MTPEEQRAVEAAKAWMDAPTVKESPLQAEWVNALDGSPADTFLFAIGYEHGDRDGYKRGVEAAMLAVTTMTLAERPVLREAFNRIRALLAREETK